jgi:hypothetical protein
MVIGAFYILPAAIFNMWNPMDWHILMRSVSFTIIFMSLCIGIFESMKKE